MIRGLIGRAARWLGLGAVVLTLAACGGGGSKTCVDVFGGTACEGNGGGTPDPVVAIDRLTLTLSKTSVNNSGSDTVVATVTAVNEFNQTVADAAVLLSVDSDAEIAVDGSETDASGRLTGTVSIGENRSNRTITVTAKAANDGSIVAEKSFQVVGATLSGTAVPAVIEPSATGEVKYRLVDAAGSPMSGTEIVVTGADGVETTGVTGSNGEFDYAYTAPGTAGNALIRATAGGDSLETTVLVQAAGGGSIPPVNPATTPVLSASVSANPSVVAVNTGSTSNQSQIRALFLTGSNAPVANVRVRFDLDGDANSIGGSFTTGSSIVYSNANGVATTAYVPGTRGSPTDGVTVRACWDYVDFAAGACPNAVRTTLTVVADPVSVTIGTNNLIGIGENELTYVKRYVVQVVDSSGVAKPDVQVSPSIDLLRFQKGYYEVQGDVWVKRPMATCDNEDLNRNNTYEVYADGWDEDANGSFNLTPGRPALEPRKADVGISFEGSSRTDAKGQVVLRIEYPQDLGTWVEFNILVAASGVSATEGRANYQGFLPVPADALTDVDVAPPFVDSPYGVLPSGLASKDFGGVTYQLCTNPN